MAKTRLRIPYKLLIVAAVSLVLGLLAGPFIQSRYTPEELADNVILNAIPFVLIFVAILLTFIGLIVVLAGLLNKRVSHSVYRIIESLLIAGIVLGVLGMFQPWLFAAYTYGFILLLFSTLAFIVWSHIVPKGQSLQEEIGPVAIPQADEELVEGGIGE
jgi:hypothetical protein